MELRPSYIFDSMMSTGINKIARGKLVLVGESVEKNTGAFIVNKDTSGLGANVTIQQALDQNYLSMINKKTEEDFGSFQFDNISANNPVISGSMKIPQTWYNTASGEIFVSKLINGSPGWQGNKGTVISKEAMPAKSGFIATNSNLPLIDVIQNNTPFSPTTKDFEIANTEFWDLGDHTKLKNGESLILPKGLVAIGDMWVVCDYPYPFPKHAILEEEQLAAERKLIGGSYPVRKITNIQPYTYYYQPHIDFLLNWSFGPYGYKDKEYVGVEPTPTKSDEPPTGADADTPSIECVSVVFQIMQGDNFQHNGVLGNGGTNMSFSAKKGVYFLHDNFLCPNYKLGLSKDGVDFLKRNEGKIAYVHNVIRHNNSNDLISPRKYWENFIY